MKTCFVVLVVCLVNCSAMAQNIIYFEPLAGLQKRRGGFDRDAPHLKKNGIDVFSYGLQVRYQHTDSSKWNYSVGAVMGGASFGYLAYISPSRSYNGQSSLLSGVAQSAEVWHFSSKFYREVKVIRFNTNNSASPALKINLVLGPQMDYMSFNQWESLSDGNISGSSNSIILKRTKLDSAQWGASLYSAIQFRYNRKSRDRVIVSIYGIYGLRDMWKYKLDYTLNGDAYSTTIRARTSAIGVSIGVPITIYPLRLLN